MCLQRPQTQWQKCYDILCLLEFIYILLLISIGRVKMTVPVHIASENVSFDGGKSLHALSSSYRPKLQQSPFPRLQGGDTFIPSKMLCSALGRGSVKYEHIL